MARIDINEIDNTIFQLSESYNNNIVYVPGNAITGPSGVPTLCTTFDQFKSIFGDESPAVEDDAIGSSWEYAANILLQGFSILYERVEPETAPAVKAAYNITATVLIDDQPTTVNVMKVEANYGGTFGNKLAFSFIKNANEIRFKTFEVIGTAYNELEDIQLLSNTAHMTEPELREALNNLLSTGLVTDYVTITMLDIEHFNIEQSYNKLKLVGGTDVLDSDILPVIPSLYSKLFDKYLYDIKFVTAGNFYDTTIVVGDVQTPIEITRYMVQLAETRQDCLAVPNIPIGYDKGNVQQWVRTNVNSSYAAVWAPWGYMNLSTKATKWMSPSYIFLRTISRSVRSGNFIWRAPAGVNRARVVDLVRPEYEIGSAIQDLWQNDAPPFVNPIMYLLGYGYTIFGQRTTYVVDGSESQRSALQELAVRITANEIKKRIRYICIGLTFEANNLRTWNAFKGQLDPYLSNMKDNGGLINYEIRMDETTTTPVDIDNNRIVGYVKVAISRAAEYFVIDFELAPAGATFNEEE